jgi:hypothetical protein
MIISSLEGGQEASHHINRFAMMYLNCTRRSNGGILLRADAFIFFRDEGRLN